MKIFEKGDILKSNSRRINLVRGRLYEVNEVYEKKLNMLNVKYQVTLIGMKDIRYDMYLFERASINETTKYKTIQRLKKLNRLLNNKI